MQREREKGAIEKEYKEWFISYKYLSLQAKTELRKCINVICTKYASKVRTRSLAKTELFQLPVFWISLYTVLYLWAHFYFLLRLRLKRMLYYSLLIGLIGKSQIVRFCIVLFSLSFPGGREINKNGNIIAGQKMILCDSSYRSRFVLV